ncbi:hypothetical protein PG994_006949 [Apiospora phragmitis]|uniref:Uncharacterized protein n=1 Tax=Apiospora phragmitis TaxID=2905665 RepID=A0ABR1VGF3_9PEZI
MPFACPFGHGCLLSETSPPRGPIAPYAKLAMQNPVLIALAEGRLPEVQPNYDYFAHLVL